MDSFTFKAIGTHWSITLEGETLESDERAQIIEYVDIFEKRFSRFLPDSLVNQYRNVVAGTYDIDPEFAVLLERCDRLRTLTDGVFDPAAGELLELAGYDASYSLTPKEPTETFTIPMWSQTGITLTLDGPIAFDLGGIGKGYFIDRVADLMRTKGHRHFLVEAGGDMYGTTKADGAPWRIAIQYPGKPDTAAGVTLLKNNAIAVSDSFRRKWGKWHHIINPKERKSVEGIVGAVAVAQNAWDADSMTSLLFLGDSEQYGAYAKEYTAQYLVFYENSETLISANWEGELF